MIEDMTAELNDIQTLTSVALAQDDLNTSQAVLRVIEQKVSQMIKGLDNVAISQSTNQ